MEEEENGWRERFRNKICGWNDKTWKDIRPFFETKEGREFFNIEERGKLSTSISN